MSKIIEQLLFIFKIFSYRMTIELAVYDDEGAFIWCVAAICKTLTQLSDNFIITTVSSHQITPEALSSYTCIIFPGGRDLPYQRKLSGRKNTWIREFVEGGGRYLGLCAGGYYGCSEIEFCCGDKTMEIKEKRELGFFKGCGQGPVFPGFDYESDRGARIVSLEGGRDDKEYVYYNGGCTFTPYSDSDFTVIRSYSDDNINNRPYNKNVHVNNNNEIDNNQDIQKNGHSLNTAIIGTKVGSGIAVLSGVHPEIGLSDLKGCTLANIPSELDNDRIAIFKDIFQFLKIEL